MAATVPITHPHSIKTTMNDKNTFNPRLVSE